jgi:hypothetical protein
MSRMIIIVNWTLSPESIITAWIPKDLHNSQPYTKIKACYTGHTTGEIIDNRLEVLYEYKINVTNLSKIIDNEWDRFDVYWQGYYNNHLLAFDFCTRNKNTKYNIQTIEELDGILSALSTPAATSTPAYTSIPIESSSYADTDATTTITTSTTYIHNGSSSSSLLNNNENQKYHHYHKFKVSEGIVLCEHCGSTPANLIYDVDGRLPSCMG